MDYDLDAKIKVEVENFKWEGELKALLWVNLDDLEKALVSQAAWTAWFCVVLGKATTLLKSKDYELDKKYSELYLNYAKPADKGERVTEATIKAKILIDMEYIKLQGEYSQLSEKVSVLSGIVRGFEHRKDMIVQLGALKRRELISGGFDESNSGVDLNKVRDQHK
jgi:hypothetical protein